MNASINISLTEKDLLELAKAKAAAVGLDVDRIAWTTAPHQRGPNNGMVASLHLAPSFGTETRTFEDEVDAWENGVPMCGVTLTVQLF